MIKLVGAVFLGFILHGCTSVETMLKDNNYAPGYSGIEKDRRIFIVPIKESFGPSVHGAEFLVREMGKQLELNGWSVVTMSRDNYLEAWSAISHDMGGLYSPTSGRLDPEKVEQATTKFIELINRAESCSAILFPSLSLKSAELKGRYAYWDGVKIKTVVTGASSMDVSWSGQTKGLSLRITAFSPSAEWMFTSYGGLALPYRTVMKGTIAVSEIREDVFEKQHDLESGVTLALRPILESNP